VLVVSSRIGKYPKNSILTGSFFGRIQACTLFAVCLYHFGSTAITAIVFTPAVVVFVVTVAVPFVCRELARSVTILSVQALALCAIFFRNKIYFLLRLHALDTAITAIPIATTVVVLVVASAIIFVLESLRTLPFAERIFLSGVQALALFAVVDSSCVVTAITAIVAAAAVVVLIIAVAIPLVIRELASPKAGGATLIVGV